MTTENETEAGSTEQEMLQVWDLTEDIEFELYTTYSGDAKEGEVLIVYSTAEQLIATRNKLTEMIEDKSLQASADDS